MNKLKEEVKDLWMKSDFIAQTSQEWLVGGRFSLCYYNYEYGSGAIDRANFESYDEALSAHNLDYRVTTIEGYTYVLIDPACVASIEICNGLLDNLESYPILDEDKIKFCDYCEDKILTYDDDSHDDCYKYYEEEEED